MCLWVVILHMHIWNAMLMQHSNLQWNQYMNNMYIIEQSHSMSGPVYNMAQTHNASHTQQLYTQRHTTHCSHLCWAIFMQCVLLSSYNRYIITELHIMYQMHYVFFNVAMIQLIMVCINIESIATCNISQLNRTQHIYMWFEFKLHTTPTSTQH